MRWIEGKDGDAREEQQARYEEQQHNRADDGHRPAETTEDDRAAFGGIKKDWIARHENLDNGLAYVKNTDWRYRDQPRKSLRNGAAIAQVRKGNTPGLVM